MLFPNSWEMLLLIMLFNMALSLSVARSTFCCLEILLPSLSATATAAATDVTVEKMPTAMAMRMGPEKTSLFSRFNVLW